MSISDSPTARPVRVLIIYTRAGGGHVSAAKSLIEALEYRYGSGVICEMVDALKEYAPKPLDRAPEAYNQLIKAPQLYRQIYELSDGKRRSKMVTDSITRYSRRGVAKLLLEHPCDIIVSAYPFAGAPILDALERQNNDTPMITVVTDMVTIPPVWLDTRATLTIVPTEPALHQAIIAGLPRERIKKIGLPVSRKFVAASDKIETRRSLGWPTESRIVLLMAGGAGVGPLGLIAQSIIRAGINAIPVVITGKNRRLAESMRSKSWASDAMIYDFVDNIATFMQAADVLVTKAGPGTIAEALNTHLPMILYSRIPGQEEGNVEFVAHTGAGYWAPKPVELVHTLRYLFSDDHALANAAAAAKRLSTPKATDEIAQLIMKTARKKSPKKI